MRPFSVHPCTHRCRHGDGRRHRHGGIEHAGKWLSLAYVGSPNENQISFAKQLDSKGRRTVARGADCGILWSSLPPVSGFAVPTTTYSTPPTYAELVRAVGLMREVHCQLIMFPTATGNLAFASCSRCGSPVHTDSHSLSSDVVCDDCQAIDAYIKALSEPNVTAEDITVVSQRLEWLAGQYMAAMQRVAL